MKAYVLRFRAADREAFEQLRDGIKSVETRAATKRYRQIQPGDELVITCAGETLRKTVISAKAYRSIDEMFQEIAIKRVFPRLSTAEEARRVYYGYAGYKEKIAECGILAMEVAPAAAL